MSSLTQPELLPCRWEWCRINFESQSDLITHVREYHIKSAPAIRQCDIPLFVRGFEGASYNDSSSASSSQSTRSSRSQSAPFVANRRPSFADLTREAEEVAEPSPPPIPPSPSVTLLLQQSRLNSKRGVPTSPSPLSITSATHPPPFSLPLDPVIETEAEKMMDQFIRTSPIPTTPSILETQMPRLAAAELDTSKPQTEVVPPATPAPGAGSVTRSRSRQTSARNSPAPGVQPAPPVLQQQQQQKKKQPSPAPSRGPGRTSPIKKPRGSRRTSPAPYPLSTTATSYSQPFATQAPAPESYFPDTQQPFKDTQSSFSSFGGDASSLFGTAALDQALSQFQSQVIPELDESLAT